MHIIPVIDIKDGQTVLAKQGQRESYQPLKSKICQLNTLENTIRSFLDIFPFKIIYIADLNAITGNANNQTIIDLAVKKFPDIQFWVDNGMKAEFFIRQNKLPYKAVIGSESQVENQLKHLKQPKQDFILSIDFFPETGYKGPCKLLEQPNLWPENIIIMSLERVGKNAGPDFARLQSFTQKNPDKNIIAAGGVRNKDDLLSLQKIDVHYALLASALHSGVISSKTMASLSAS